MPKQLTDAQTQQLATLATQGKPMATIRQSLESSGYDASAGELAIMKVQRSAIGKQSDVPPPAASATSAQKTPSAPDPDDPMGDFGPAYDKTADFLGFTPADRKFDRGAVKSIKSTASSIGNIAKHPVDTLGNLANAAMHPTQTGRGLVEGVTSIPGMLKDAATDPGKAGELAGNLVGFGGAGKALGALGKVGKAGKVASAAGKAVTTGVAAPALIAAGDPSLKDQPPEERNKAIGGALGGQAIFHAVDLALGKGLGATDQVLGGKIAPKLPVDQEMLRDAAGRASERIRSKGIDLGSKWNPIDFAAYAVGKGVRLMATPNSFTRNAGKGQGDLTKLYAKHLEITKEDLHRLGYTEADLRALEKKMGVPVVDALGHLAAEEITPEVIQASKTIIGDRYQKFWTGKQVNVDGGTLTNMSSAIMQKLRSKRQLDEFEKYMQEAAPGLLAPNGKLIAQRMSGEEFQKIRGDVSKIAHSLSSKIAGPGSSASEVWIGPVAEAMHAVREHLDAAADKGLSGAQRVELRGLKKTYQAVSDFESVFQEGKIQGGVYIPPTELLDYIKRSNPARYKRTKEEGQRDDLVDLGRDFDTLGVQATPRGLVTKYGQRRYARGRNSVVNAFSVSDEQQQTQR